MSAPAVLPCTTYWFKKLGYPFILKIFFFSFLSILRNHSSTISYIRKAGKEGDQVHEKSPYFLFLASPRSSNLGINQAD